MSEKPPEDELKPPFNERENNRPDLNPVWNSTPDLTLDSNEASCISGEIPGVTGGKSFP